ncbi:hypothetical protein FOA52_016062 [Chlamydomonas sp. UWO 241]|nr:hypothetical protein FOA52_016062 [Chlamydomonas sp. UWO 241]
MPRVRGACMRALLLLSVGLRVCSADSDAACPKITSQCIAGHVRDILALSNTIYSSADDEYDAAAAVVTQFVERCMGGGAEGSQAFRPLRLMSTTYSKEDSLRMMDDFTKKTGFKIITDWIEPAAIVSELVWTNKHAPLTYDGWISDSTTVVDIITSTTMLAPINSFIRADETLQWPDVTKYVREIRATYAGNIVGVPMGNNPLFLYFRNDVFLAAGLDPPTTWENMIMAATMLNDSDFNHDGIKDYALCLQLDECIGGEVAVSMILASMTQTAGPQTGFLFDPQTMESFVGSAAMEATLELLQQMLRYSTSGCALVSPDFLSGACAMTISIDSLFKVIQRNSTIRDWFSVARQPGSTRVLNRQTGLLEECTRELCPYAELERTYDGQEVLINKAPGSGNGGIAGFVNARQDPVYQQLAYDYYSFRAEPEYSSAIIKETYIIGPFRTSHLDTSMASLQEWKSAGFNPDAVKEMLEIVQRDIEHPNSVPILRIRGGASLMNAFLPAVRNASAGMAPKTIASNLVAEYAAILAVSGPIADVRASLWAGLAIVPPALPLPPLPPSDGNDGGIGAAPGSVLNLSLVLGVTIPVTIVLLLLILLALFVVMRHSNRTLFGRHWVPAAGEERTTLVVTDIMDSTALWEMLDASGMSRAVATHHSIVRKALARFHGYEQATEGDSFLLAFHTPCDALRFAVQLQAGLLSADWEPELLAHPSCAPVAMAQSAVLLSAGGGDDRFQLRCAAAMLAVMGGGEEHSGSLRKYIRAASIKANRSTCASVRTPDASAAMMPRISALVGGGDNDAAMNATPPRKHFGRLSRTMGDGAAAAADDLDSLLFPELHVNMESMLVGKGSCYKKHKAVAEVSEAPGASAMRGTATMAEYMQLAVVVETGAREAGARAPKDKQQAAIMFRGLRVRVGMHSGVSKTDVERNATAGRMFFTGTPLALAKAVGDAGAGGMILMTQDMFQRINPALAPNDALLLCMGDHRVKDACLDPVCLYQAIARPLVPRLAAFEALRDVEKLQLSVLDAPLGNVTIAFVNIVGMSTLQAWNKDHAARALSVFRALSTRLLRQAGGYLVERTSSGLCLAAFSEPASAVAWGLCLIEVMKHADWDEELLAHELCEKVLVHAPNTGEIVTENGTPCAGHVLFRGPRIKVGIDVGQVQADVSPVTGRMTYRGKVMNRSARICGKASSGMRWCSAAVWQRVVSTCGEQLPSTGLLGTELGAFELKGISDSVHLVQIPILPSVPARSEGPGHPPHRSRTSLLSAGSPYLPSSSFLEGVFPPLAAPHVFFFTVFTCTRPEDPGA